jgi:hypothetical protein
MKKMNAMKAMKAKKAAKLAADKSVMKKPAKHARAEPTTASTSVQMVTTGTQTDIIGGGPWMMVPVPGPRPPTSQFPAASTVQFANMLVSPLVYPKFMPFTPPPPFRPVAPKPFMPPPRPVAQAAPRTTMAPMTPTFAPSVPGGLITMQLPASSSSSSSSAARVKPEPEF